MKRFPFLSRLATSVAAAALLFGSAVSLASCDEDETVDPVVVPRLDAPANPALDAAASEGDRLTFGWEASEGAATYTARLYMNRDGAVVRETVTELLTVSFEGLLSDCDYYLRVRANDPYNEARNSLWSEWVEARTPEIEESKEPMPVPANILCSEATDAKFTFVWDEVPAARDYTCKLVMPDGREVVETVAATTVSFDAPEADAAYKFSVRTNPREENKGVYRPSDFSAPLTVRTAGVLAVPAPAVVAAATTAGTLKFEWEAVEGAASYGYELRLGDAVVAEDETANLTVTFPDLEAATEYAFRVKALPAAGALFRESGYSDYVVAATQSAKLIPLAAPEVTATPIATVYGTTAASFVWAPVEGAASYEFSVDGEEMQPLAPAEGATELSVLRRLNPGEHTFTVRALVAEGELVYENSADKSYKVTVGEASVPAEGAMETARPGDWKLTGKYTATTVVDGLTVFAEGVSIDATSGTIKMGGNGSFEADGSPRSRILGFKVTEPGMLKVTYKSANKADSPNRNCAVMIGAGTEPEINPCAAEGAAATIERKVAATTPTWIFVYSYGGGINVDAIAWTPDSYVPEPEEPAEVVTLVIADVASGLSSSTSQTTVEVKQIEGWTFVNCTNKTTYTQVQGAVSGTPDSEPTLYTGGIGTPVQEGYVVEKVIVTGNGSNTKRVVLMDGYTEGTGYGKCVHPLVSGKGTALAGTEPVELVPTEDCARLFIAATANGSSQVTKVEVHYKKAN